MLSWRATWQATTTFLTGCTQPYTLALTRIAVGLASLLNAGLLAPDAIAWFGQDGVLAGGGMASEAWQLNLFAWLGTSASVVMALMGFYACCALSLTLGFFSRTSGFLVYLCCASFCQRNVYAMSSADSLLRLLPLFLALSPCHTTLSLDQWLHNRRTGRALAPAPGPGLRLIQLQVCLLYLVTAIHKAAGSMWRDGSAVHTVLQLTEFQRFPLPDFVHMPVIASLLTWSTLGVEFLFPVLIWFRETRRFILAAAILFHLSLEYALNIQMFQIAMLAALSAFFLDEELQALARFRRKLPWRHTL